VSVIVDFVCLVMLLWRIRSSPTMATGLLATERPREVGTYYPT
jgi:hypothetical protein